MPKHPPREREHHLSSPFEADQPAETQSETPSETQSETPAETPSETPAEAPAETPSETPSETPTVADPFANVNLDLAVPVEVPGAVFPVSDKALALARKLQAIGSGKFLRVPIPGVPMDVAQTMITELSHCGPHLTPKAVIRATVTGAGADQALKVSLRGKPGRKKS